MHAGNVPNYRSFTDRGNYDVEVNVKNYFEHFHPSLPLLHRPTFTVSSAPKLLLKAVTVIGSLCSTVVYNDEEAQARVHWRRDTWQSGQQELRNMVHVTSFILSFMCWDTNQCRDRFPMNAVIYENPGWCKPGYFT